jgi:hypothetical protein
MDITEARSRTGEQPWRDGKFRRRAGRTSSRGRTSSQVTCGSILAAIVGELPPGPIKDRCLLVLAGKQSESEPGPALEFGLQTAAGPGRDQSLQTIFHKWSESQPSEAQSWLERQDPSLTGFLRSPAALPQ